MNNEKTKANLDLESRVKLNIYKTLLEEEKSKNKRNTTIGLSLFVVGIVSTTTLYQIKDDSHPQKVTVNPTITKTVVTSKKTTFPKYLESNADLDIFNSNILESKRMNNIKEEDFFVSDFKF